MAELPETISIDEQAQAAGRPRIVHVKDIEALTGTINAFCDNEVGTSPALSNARGKFQEALFWLREHRTPR